MNRGWKRKKENEVRDEMEFHFTYNKRACWWKLSTWTGRPADWQCLDKGAFFFYHPLDLIKILNHNL
jgi:hypothetical protein